ncbi:hypothetical protein H072_4668 [Dactylellina haptotyla CBS 200.50]|uniref:F-box domain-containing protein n=1 Tax=Dactylellina haptotyla (strain CBS 200.50) TaxID=1284197 RepID=S8C1H8_DACHA|nr:hypothetical protein H072_4668 [Dactylellina haptotyla CBS 200.50]
MSPRNRSQHHSSSRTDRLHIPYNVTPFLPMEILLEIFTYAYPNLKRDFIAQLFLSSVCGFWRDVLTDKVLHESRYFPPFFKKGQMPVRAWWPNNPACLHKIALPPCGTGILCTMEKGVVKESIFICRLNKELNKQTGDVPLPPCPERWSCLDVTDHPFLDETVVSPYIVDCCSGQFRFELIEVAIHENFKGLVRYTDVARNSKPRYRKMETQGITKFPSWVIRQFGDGIENIWTTMLPIDTTNRELMDIVFKVLGPGPYGQSEDSDFNLDSPYNCKLLLRWSRYYGVEVWVWPINADGSITAFRCIYGKIQVFT